MGAPSRGGLLSGLAPMIPGLLRQAAGQLQELSAEEVDGALEVLAQWLLAARSVEAQTLLEQPSHNLD